MSAPALRFVSVQKLCPPRGAEWPRTLERALGLAQRVASRRLRPGDRVDRTDHGLVLRFADGDEQRASRVSGAILAELERLARATAPSPWALALARATAHATLQTAPVFGADGQATPMVLGRLSPDAARCLAEAAAHDASAPDPGGAVIVLQMTALERWLGATADVAVVLPIASPSARSSVVDQVCRSVRALAAAQRRRVAFELTGLSRTTPRSRVDALAGPLTLAGARVAVELPDRECVALAVGARTAFATAPAALLRGAADGGAGLARRLDQAGLRLLIKGDSGDDGFAAGASWAAVH